METLDSSLPVHRIDTIMIPLGNGVSLSGRIWLPKGSDLKPVPTIVDYHPYRSYDFSAIKDNRTYSQIASRNYACIKLDARGTGNSSGLHTDQFAECYWSDLSLALEWIEAQPWCNGRIGMTGLSWPAHAGIMAASRHLKQVHAIAPISGAIDRYLNRYQGGCMMLYTVWWGALLAGMQARPPIPWIKGDGWRAEWLERLGHFRNFFELWGAHPTFGSYWQAGSALPGLSKANVPILSIAGWADTGYAHSSVAILENASAPSRSIIGPWGHRWPQDAMPGPALDGVDLVTRWFDGYLKGESDAIKDWPRMIAWMNQSAPPQPDATMRHGNWVSENCWPPLDVSEDVLYLTTSGLRQDSTSAAEKSIRSPLSVGTQAGDWMPYFAGGPAPNLPGDQAEDDAKSLVFDTLPLTEELELLGTPVANLHVSADAPDAQIVVRLNDVAPDGTSVRMTFGFLNLAHREGDIEPLPVVAHSQYKIQLKLFPLGYRLAKGHRIRLAISTSYWPIIWPSRDRARLTVHLGDATLCLPRRAAGNGRTHLPAPRPFSGADIATTVIAPSARRSSQVKEGVATLEIVEFAGCYRFADDYEFSSGQTHTFTINEDDPLSACCKTSVRWTMQRGDWQTSVAVDAQVLADREHFHTVTQIVAKEGGTPMFENVVRRSLPRPGLAAS